MFILTIFVISDKKKESVANVISEPQNTISENIGGKNFSLEIASNEPSRELGLGQRDTLAENAGMIFAFPRLDKYGFWMKDTKFPLDILWLNQNCVVVGKATMTPKSFPKVFYPDFPALYAIELPVGSANNTKESDTLFCDQIKGIQSN